MLSCLAYFVKANNKIFNLTCHAFFVHVFPREPHIHVDRMLQDTLAFVAATYPDWSIDGNIINLKANKASKSDEIPSMKLISQTLSYATELERIV
jgi:hypothetical protein